MDFKKYSNRLDYPSRHDYKTQYWYRNGNCVAMKGANDAQPVFTGIETCLKDTVTSSSIDDESFQKAMKAYHTEDNNLTDLFRNDLFEDLDIQNNSKKGLLFSKAWELGHSGGLTEVYWCAVNLVELIK